MAHSYKWGNLLSILQLPSLYIRFSQLLTANIFRCILDADKLTFLTDRGGQVVKFAMFQIQVETGS